MRFADKNPKARHHALVVARDPRLVTPSDLLAGDVPLLQHMQVRNLQILLGDAGDIPLSF